MCTKLIPIALVRCTGTQLKTNSGSKSEAFGHAHQSKAPGKVRF